MIPVNSAQFRRTVRLCNSQKKNWYLTWASHFFLTSKCVNVTKRLSVLVLLWYCCIWYYFYVFFSPLWQFRIHILKLHLQYGGIHIWLYIRTINMSGDLKNNSGPSPISCQKFLIFHRNLNSINLSIHFSM